MAQYEIKINIPSLSDINLPPLKDIPVGLLPIYTFIFVYLMKVLTKKFEEQSEKAINSLWLSEKKDKEVEEIFTDLEESSGASRVVFGVVVNGQTSLNGSYHVRRLIITHESMKPGLASALLANRSFNVASLKAESDLYNKNDFVYAYVGQDSLEPACRRYLDSISCQGILTYRLVLREKKEEPITVAYVSFQWLQTPLFKDDITSFLKEFDRYLHTEFNRDLIYYQNKLISVVTDNAERRKDLNNFFGLLRRMLFKN